MPQTLSKLTRQVPAVEHHPTNPPQLQPHANEQIKQYFVKLARVRPRAHTYRLETIADCVSFEEAKNPILPRSLLDAQRVYDASVANLVYACWKLC